MKLAGASALSLAGLGLGSSSASASGPEDTSNWQLAFEDTFDSGSLDTSKWGVGFGWGRETNGSPERIVDENVEIRNGQLHLKGTHDGSDYKAGGVNTKGKAYFGPGSYWEAKIKMPDRVGFLPAFWSKPNDESWPPEIDFVELFQTDGSSSDTNVSHHHIHYSSSTESGDSSTHQDEPASYNAGVDLTNDFHVYGCKWLQDRLVHYVDGVKVAECTDSTIMQALSNGAPFYMMLNIHIDRIGTADASESWGEEMVTEWVRVWDYAPDSGSTSDTTDTTSDGTDDTTSDSTNTTDDTTSDSTTNDTEHYLWVRSADSSQATYAFEASGGGIRIDPNEQGDNESDEWIADDQQTAGGTVSGDYLSGDGFFYYGDISDLQYSGPLEVFIDDQYVEPDSLVDSTRPGPNQSSDSTTDSTSDSTTDSTSDSTTDSTSSSSLPNTITIEGSNSTERVPYSFSVSDSIQATDMVNDNDTISGQTAEGQVHGGTDEFAFSGDITSLRVHGAADVYVNGTKVRLLRINRAPDSNRWVRYIVETTGRLLKADVQEASINAHDKVRGEKARGKVRGGADAYWLLDGNVVDVSTFGGDVVTDFDGEQIDYTD